MNRNNATINVAGEDKSIETTFDAKFLISTMDCSSELLLQLLEGGELISGSSENNCRWLRPAIKQMLEEAELMDNKKLQIWDTIGITSPELNLTVRYPAQLEAELEDRVDQFDSAMIDWEIL